MGGSGLVNPSLTDSKAPLTKPPMRAGHASGDDYTDGYRWGEPQERNGDPDTIIADVVAEIECTTYRD